MNYAFPKIRHISDVLPAIEGRDEFIIARKDGYQVVNYAVAFEDTFPEVNTVRMANGDEQLRGEASDPIFETTDDYHAALRRECRGLIFDEDGNLMSRRYHKFFNVNERDETRADRVDWSKPHRILEKLDGSMISPISVRGNLRWTTKMGITDTAMQAEVFVAKNPQYTDLAWSCISQKLTPVFEWCSNKNRIVLEYPEDFLVLTAIRDNETGAYMNYEDLVKAGAQMHIPVVVAHEITDDLIRTIAKWEGSEGVVVRFDDGHMLKIKAEWYVVRHKSKDAITREKNVMDYIINDRVDDVLPFLEPNDQKRLQNYQREVHAGIDRVAATYEAYFQNVLASNLDRKSYALQWMPTIKDQDSFAPQYVFARFNGRNSREILMDQIRKNIGAQARVDEHRKLWDNLRWEYSFDGDA